MGGEVYDPGAGRFTAVETLPEPAAVPPHVPRVEMSVPSDGATDVPLAPRLVFRFSAPVRVETVTSETVTLSGPEGSEAVAVTAAEGGMLAFIRPLAPLLPGATYTLSLNGAEDGQGLVLPFTAIQFRTREAPAGPEGAGVPPTSESTRRMGTPAPAAHGDAEGAGEDDDWEWKGERRNGRPYSRWQSLPPLAAPAGVTALAGQVLRLNGEPLADVTLQMERGSGGGLVSARTDDTGRFLLADIKVGPQELLIDGRSASGPGRTYGVFEVGVRTAAGQTTGLGYTVWMPRIDTAHAVTIPTHTPTELVITTPRIPGLELRLPAHSGIRDHEGTPATEISLTPIPQDRPPFPLPQGVAPPAYFTIQPGAGYVYSQDGGGARLIYPNAKHALPGTRFQFWHYDPGEKGWYVYGRGTVTEGGQQIVPDPRVTVYEFTGAMAADAGLGYAEGPAAAPLTGADPVDLGTGLFVMRKTDLVLPDLLPIVLTRTYRPGDGQSRAFGLGMSHAYDLFLVGDINPYTYLDLFLPDGTGSTSRASPRAGAGRTRSTSTPPPPRASSRRASSGTRAMSAGT